MTSAADAQKKVAAPAAQAPVKAKARAKAKPVQAEAVQAEAPKAEAVAQPELAQDAKNLDLGAAHVGTNDGQPGAIKRMLGTAGAVDKATLLKDTKLSVISGVPFEAMFQSQQYRRGEIKANDYVGKVAANAMGYGAWTIGGALASAGLCALFPALAPAGLLIGVAGFAAGMLANNLWDRTAGKVVSKAIAAVIPEKVAKPFADGFTKFIANPFIDHVWKPVTGFLMHHKILAGAAVAGLALKFPMLAKGLGREAGVMAAGTAVGMGLSHFTLDKVLPASQDKTSSAPATGSAFGPEINGQIQLDDQTRALLRQRYAQAFDWNSPDAQEVADAEKLYYVKALSETQSDPTKIKQLEDLFGAMQQEFNARWSQAQPADPIATRQIHIG